MVLYLAGICRIYSCWLVLFRLIIQCLNFDGETPINLSGVTLNLNGGMLTFDGGRVSVNLSTAYIQGRREPNVGPGPAQICRISGFVKSKIDGENAAVWSENDM